MPAMVFDSYALLAFLRAEPGGETVQELLNKASDRDDPIHMSEVNYAEVQYIVRRKDGDAAWQQIRKELPTLPIAFHPVTRELADAAADFKARYAVSLADAFAAALAKVRKAELVTGDLEFKSLARDLKIRWLPS